MSKPARHAISTVALTLVALGALTGTSTAERFYQGRDALSKDCAKQGGSFAVEHTGAYSCVYLDQGLARNCTASGSCATVDTRRPEGTPSGGPNGGAGGKDKIIAKDSSPGWNGQYTTVVVTEGRGTRTYTVKQGVPIENGQMIMAPNGASYHVWDPELARQLKAAGVDAAYANPATAKNEYALARDKVVRDRAIAAGQPVPQPTGHRNRDALGNPASLINDHRKETTAAPTQASPVRPPPAAAPGSVSSAPASNPDAAPRVSDHRHPAGSTSGHEGGVTVTRTARTPSGANPGSSRDDGNRNRQ
jgi:hypothetical protein